MNETIGFGADESLGAFAWKRRMGVHEAYHQARENRIIHWVAIPLEVWAVTKLLACIELGSVDLALVALLLVAPIFAIAEPVLGIGMIAILAIFREIALHVLYDSPWAGALMAVMVFGGAFAAQIFVGHRVFEQGRDDTKRNLAELRQTKNPIPTLLVFFYHLVELALALGYKPALREEIARFTSAELDALRLAGALPPTDATATADSPELASAGAPPAQPTEATAPTQGEASIDPPAPSPEDPPTV